MGVLSVLIALQASAGRDGVRRRDFLTLLEIKDDDPIEYIEVPETGLVQFPIVRLSECQSASEPTEELSLRINNILLCAAQFLDQRETAVFETMRHAGVTVRVFVDIRMDQDQFEFDLPPEFVRACGRRGLGIYLMSNDISAEESLQRGAN